MSAGPRSVLYCNDVDRQNVAIPYDYLILATGAGPEYFGHDEFKEHAPSLKTLADAVAVRTRSWARLSWPRPKKIPAVIATC